MVGSGGGFVVVGKAAWISEEGGCIARRAMEDVLVDRVAYDLDVLKKMTLFVSR